MFCFRRYKCEIASASHLLNKKKRCASASLLGGKYSYKIEFQLLIMLFGSFQCARDTFNTKDCKFEESFQ